MQVYKHVYHYWVQYSLSIQNLIFKSIFPYICKKNPKIKLRVQFTYIGMKVNKILKDIL